jgi:hypothetical protein
MSFLSPRGKGTHRHGPCAISHGNRGSGELLRTGRRAVGRGLRHRWRRVGRMRACQPAEREGQRPPSGGGRARQLPLGAYPGGYLYCIGNPRTDWGYRTAEEPGLNGRSLLYPRGNAGRVLLDQRHDLHARSGGGLRWLAAAWPIPAGAGTTCCPISRNPRTNSDGPTRCMAPAASGGWTASDCTGISSTDWREAAIEAGLPPVDRFQHRRQRRASAISG